MVLPFLFGGPSRVDGLLFADLALLFDDFELCLAESGEDYIGLSWRELMSMVSFLVKLGWWMEWSLLLRKL